MPERRVRAGVGRVLGAPGAWRSRRAAAAEEDADAEAGAGSGEGAGDTERGRRLHRTRDSLRRRRIKRSGRTDAADQKPDGPAAVEAGADEAADVSSTGSPAEDSFAGRDRLVAALRRPGSRGQAIAGALLAVLGFAAAVQVRAIGQDDTYDGARQQDLISLINRLSLAAERAEGEISDLELTRDALRNDALAGQTAQAIARQEAETLGILAGTLPATGPGIRVTVTDRGGQVGTDLILNGIGELRDAGAEAIELNDAVRVVASTPVEDGSPGLVVDGVELTPPYTIDVIGDPLTLSSALDFIGGFKAEVVEVGGRVEVVQSGAIDIASTLPSPDLQYAEPVPEE